MDPGARYQPCAHSARRDGQSIRQITYRRELSSTPALTSGEDLSKAFTFEAGQWKAVSGDDATVKIGRGYWVLLTKDGNITPGTER